jgi:hypothetical protein
VGSAYLPGALVNMARGARRRPDVDGERPLRGGFAKFFRYFSLIGTPLAVVTTFVLPVS